jgi:hypothetical protein
MIRQQTNGFGPVCDLHIWCLLFVFDYPLTAFITSSGMSKFA